MTHRLTALLLASSAFVTHAHLAQANPLGGQVVGGSATIAGQGTAAVTVTQTTPNAIINWQNFNIGAGEATTFVQPSAQSVVLNRVTGGEGPSTINGALSGNGQVFLVNPDGILIGPTGRINTGGFLATTHDIANSDFMAGRYQFSISGKADASVVNQGSITAASGGFAALVAPGARNSGTITAQLGTVALASGNSFSLDFYGDQLITLGVNDSVAAQVKDVSTGQSLKSLVENSGKIKANGGRVQLTAVAARQIVDSVINNTGVIEANSIGRHKGMIVLGAATASTKPAGAPQQVVKVAGRLSTAGKKKGQAGGTIVVTGETVKLANAKLDASGQNGGGHILIGGDDSGGTPNAAVAGNPKSTLEPFSIATASDVSIDAKTGLNASALSSGNGGKVIVWSDSNTAMAGSIDAKGGAASGNGGFVETSSHGNLDVTGSIAIGATNGAAGSWLLDPQDLTIASTGTFVVTPAAIESALASGNVVVTTSSGTGNGDLFVEEPISWSSANALTLSAYRNIEVDEAISNTAAASVNLRADNSGTGTGMVNFGTRGSVSTAGNVSIFYDPTVNPAGSAINSTSYVSPVENYTSGVIGGATLSTYMLVNSFADLQNIQNNLSGDYALGRSIDAGGMSAFVPLGNYSRPFSGIFEGNNNSISNLYISIGSVSGLFGVIGLSGKLADFSVNAKIVDGQGSGVVAGENDGEITNVSASGTVDGAGAGFVADNLGSIASSSSSVSVGQNNMMGNDSAGFVAYNAGTITNSSATGNVNGHASTATGGGFVGENDGTITGSYASGSVSGFNGVEGGFVGDNEGNITNSYATSGTVVTTNILCVCGASGGFAGGQAGGSIASSYSTDLVGTPRWHGGFVGVVYGGTFQNSYWDNQASGQSTDAAPSGTNALTTSVLKAALPTGFDSTVWQLDASTNSGYPSLIWQTQTTPQPTTTTLIGSAISPTLISITIQADDESKVYGSNDPQLVYQITSGTLAPGDSFAGALTRATGENVGNYAISQGSLTPPSGYTLVFDPATFQITAAPLTITANDRSKSEGVALTLGTTAFTTGTLYNNDTVTGVALASAGASTGASASGSPYAITASNAQGNGLGNYRITYVSGALTVRPSPVSPSTTNPDQVFASLVNSQTSRLANFEIGASTLPVRSPKLPGNIDPYAPLNYVTLPALEAILTDGLHPFIAALPPSLAGSFQSDLQSTLLKMTDGDQTIKLEDGGINILSLAVGDLISHYIDLATDELNESFGPIVAGSGRYALQVGSNTTLNYLSAAASDPALLATGWAGVTAAFDIAIVQSTIGDVVDLGQALAPGFVERLER